MFSGDETKKSVKVLSGGEKGRMIYGKLMMTKPNVMLMDEPTNHMDMETIESLQIGLEKYPGTLLFVSHDREFVGTLATRIIELQPGGGIIDFKGSYDDYLKAPLTILDIRDSGWSPLAGFFVAAVYAIAAGLRLPVQREPLGMALGTAALVWTLGTIALSATEGGEERLPALRLLSSDGRTVTLTDFQGKPTVVNLWATWCPPCRREMPVLQQAQADRPDVNFVFLNQGESASQVQTFLTAHKLPLGNVLLDSRREAGAQLGHRALPTTLFFDAHGRMIDTRIGELSRATLNQRLAAIAPVAPLQ